MANLIHVKMEVNPFNDGSIAWFAYFEGTPSPEEVEAALDQHQDLGRGSSDVESISAAMGDEDEFREMRHGGPPQQFQDEVANMAGLERWYICQAT